MKWLCGNRYTHTQKKNATVIVNVFQINIIDYHTFTQQISDDSPLNIIKQEFE